MPFIHCILYYVLPLLVSRSWQVVEFEALPVTFIKLVGIQNTANEVSYT
jgi:hypothetical protein